MDVTSVTFGIFDGRHIAARDVSYKRLAKPTAKAVQLHHGDDTKSTSLGEDVEYRSIVGAHP
jgi:hypothetical protein